MKNLTIANTTSKISDPVLNRVLFVGPDINGRGGISSVLSIYRDTFSPFHYLPTNSRKGTVAGLCNLALTMLRLPLERLKGRRLMHIHYASGKSWKRKRLLSVWGRLLGFRLIMHCHCNFIRMTELHGPSSIGSALKKASANITLATCYRNFAVRQLELDNVSIINNPVTPAQPSNTQKESQTTFLFLGLLDRNKGIFDLVEAAKRLKDQGFAFKIIMAGTGPDEDSIKQLTHSYGLDENFAFPGWISGDEKLDAIGRSHIFVLPSHSEGMPMSILETKAHGIPAISTAVGAIPDIISHDNDGFVIDIGDVDALVRAMSEYIQDTEKLKAHSDKCLKNIGNYMPDRVGAELINLYRACLRI